MLLMPSCTKESDIEFDESLLYGKWQEGTVFEKYNADGTGSTWDTSDDVSEDEAQAFEWTLSKDDLTQIHIMEIGGGRIPKSYTVTVLTSNNLKYHDAYDSHSFTKVN
jgi:hypothetical protein